MTKHLSFRLWQPRITRVALALAFVGLASACDVHGITAPGDLAVLTVSPNPDTLAVNGTQQFTATGQDFSGRTVPVTDVRWSVASGGGKISSTGLFTADTLAGAYANTVVATSHDISGTATVVVLAPNSAPPVIPDSTTPPPVSPPTLASITISPNPDTLGIGGQQQFVAVGRDSSGKVLAITPSWSVANGGGTIGSSGIFTAGATAGTYANTVKAVSGTKSATATVVVSAAAPVLASITVTPNPDTTQTGASQQFTAVGRDAKGNTYLIKPTWSVVNGGGVIDANGRFTAGSVANTFNNTVRATSGSVFGTATVTVLATVPPPTPALINLGAAAPNGIMAGTAVTCVTGGIIHADVSISPGNTITGFGPCAITGVQHLNDAIAAQAQIDLTNAYNKLAGLPCPPANAIVGNLGGTTKTAGVYCTAGGIGVTGTLTLDGGGDPNATFVFQAGSSLTTAGDIVLINGAQAKNVYWQVGSSATIGTSSHIQGNIIAYTSITLVDNATLVGRALARNGAVSLGTNNAITLP